MPKPSKRSSAPKTSPPTPSSTSKLAESSAEFTQAPSSLQPFVEPLSRKHVYLVHLDTQPRAIKRQIFMFPLFLNLLIIAIIAYRAHAGIYIYPDIILATLGKRDNPAAIDTSTAPWGLIGKTIAQRTVTFLIDYLLVTLFLPWPIRFWTGPMRWRRKLGFQNVEVVVRKSREWSQSLADTDTDNNNTVWARIRNNNKNGEIMNERILPAMSPTRLANKTGFLMIDADWDLDFDAMIQAHGIIDAKAKSAEGGKKLREHFGPFLSCVLIYGGESSGWLVWRVDERDAQANSNKSAVGEADDLSQSQRDKILSFKNKLTDMGKEDLFFRWVELVQFESTQPGGFTPERQRKTMLEVRELFEKDGVDFEKFWADVGGMEGISIES